MKKGTRIIIAGGGTGGHVFPAIAIANALKKIEQTTEILFVGAKGKMEMEKVPQAGFEIIGLDIAGFDRSSLIKNIGLPVKLIRSLLKARSILKKFLPDVVVGVGGYASFPMLFMAQRMNIPTVIQEQNSFAGKTNKILGKKAAAICVAYEGMDKFFPKEKVVLTGNPVRSALLDAKTGREEAIKFFELETGKKTILIVGGSLGARSINEAVDKDLELLIKAELQVIWQTGKLYKEKAGRRIKDLQGVWTGEFISRMDLAYTAADVVISRAGAIAIAELSLLKKPAVLVPYPIAAENHQAENARSLVQKNAALMISDNETKDKLIPAVIALAGNDQLKEELKKNIGVMANARADEQIAEEIFKSLRYP